MRSHTEDDNNITTEERDENSSEEGQSSIATEDSSEVEIDSWGRLYKTLNHFLVTVL